MNGSFYLNAKKISACRMVQNFTSLRASSVQVLCKFCASLCTCVAAPEVPGTSVNVNMLPLPSPDRQLRPKKRRRVQPAAGEETEASQQ